MRKNSEYSAHAEAAETKIELAECLKKNAKLSRMQTVIVAAKLKFQELARSLTKRLDDQENTISLLQNEALESQRKADESKIGVR